MNKLKILSDYLKSAGLTKESSEALNLSNNMLQEAIAYFGTTYNPNEADTFYPTEICWTSPAKERAEQKEAGPKIIAPLKDSSMKSLTTDPMLWIISCSKLGPLEFPFGETMD